VVKNKQPEYVDYFRYMVDEYDYPCKPTAKERFYVHDLEKNQYPHLVGPVSPERVDFTDTDEAADTVREFALSMGADLVGFTELTPEMVFRGADVKGRYVISIGIAMDHDLIDTAPDPPAGVEALRTYWKLGHVVLKVSQFVRSMGYEAQGHQVRTFLGDLPTVLHTVASIKSGLGELGRIGILVTEEFGPCIRVGTVTTELELPDEGERSFGVDEFCTNCRLCADNCRGEAIPLEKTLVYGKMRYRIDPYRCLPEFARYDGCGICIKVCPFNRPISNE